MRVRACVPARHSTRTCLQTVFSDTYVGYTTTLASTLCAEMNTLNHPDGNGDKVQVLHAHARTHAHTLTCPCSAEGPGGQRGGEAAVAAPGARVPNSRLPEPHPGESGQFSRGRERSREAVFVRSQRVCETCPCAEFVAVDGERSSRLQPPARSRASSEGASVPLSQHPGGGREVGGRRRCRAKVRGGRVNQGLAPEVFSH